MSDSDARHDATMAKWARKKEKWEDARERTIATTKEILGDLWKEQENRTNINREISRAANSGEVPHTKQGYGDIDGEVITGFKKPWER